MCYWKCWCDIGEVGVIPATAAIMHSPTMTALAELPTSVTGDIEEQAVSTESTRNGTLVGFRDIVP